MQNYVLFFGSWTIKKYALVSSVCAALSLSFGVDIAFAAGGLRSLPSKGAISIEPNIGTSFSVSGNFLDSAILNRGSGEIFTISGTAIAVGGIGGFIASITSRQFYDVYNTPYKIGLNLNYGLSNNSEVFGSVRYTQASGKIFNVIDVSGAGVVVGRAIPPAFTVRGKFDDYHELAFEGGYRHFYSLSGKFKPYAAVILGVRRVGKIEIDLSESTSGTTINNIKFFDKTVAYRAGFQAGFLYDFSTSIAVGIETGVIYNSGLKADDTDLSSAESLAASNNGGGSLEIPLTAKVNIAF